MEHLKALTEAVELCSGRVPEEVLAEARRACRQADRRLALSGSATVVALAGATGSGKSSTFNALTGTELAAVGVRRPTTAHAMAAVWHEEDAEDLLDWLKIPRRHVLEPTPIRAPRWTAWCCWTCRTTTRPRWRTGWRSTGWCSWSTC